MKTKSSLSAGRKGILLVLAAFAGVAARQSGGAELDGADAVGELPEVQVSATRDTREGTAESGYRNVTATTGPLGQMPLQDTPYSINVTSGELIENRSAHTVSDALKTNPTVSSVMESSGYSSMSRVMVRGFTAADQNDQRDGLIDRSFTYVPLENVERIEVLNGLSSFLYGFAALGGSVNFVSKQPTRNPFLSVAAGQYGGGINYLHGDAGGPVDADGRWSSRVNVYGENGSTYLAGSKQKRTLVSGVVNFKVTPGTSLHADVWQQSLEMRGISTYINVNPAAGIMVPSADKFSATTQYGQDWTFNQSEKMLLGLGMESILNDTFTLRAAYRYGDMWRDYLFVNATLTDNTGSYSEKATGTTRQTEQTNSAYALLDADFHTGSVGHKVTLGYTGTSFTFTRGADVSTTLGNSDISAPVYYPNPNLIIGPTNASSTTWYKNVVLGDKVEFSNGWSALVGFNQAKLVSTTGASQSKLSPSYALLFKPAPVLTTYVSYMEGLQTGGTAPATAANAYAVLSPSASYQYELGAKGSLGQMDWTAALFQIGVINQYTDPTDNIYKQDGREVHKGLELTATGKLTDRVTLIGGLMRQNSAITKAKNNVALEGKTPVNVPDRQARLYLEYALADVGGLILSGGANYSGSRPVDAANVDYLDGATTYDAGLRYETRAGGRKLNFNLNVSNLFNTSCWTYYRSGDGLLLGAPRVISFTAKAEM